MRELQERITSNEFTELWAFARRYTLAPDVCRTLGSVGSALCETQTTPEDFMPVVRQADDEAKRRTAEG